MNLRDLHYLVAVADLQHFGKAAEQCFVSQPTLSGQIKKLEQQLGITLFERNNRRVMLTEIGQQIVASARIILQEARTIQETAKAAQDPFAGSFRLGAFPTLATYIFPKLVANIKHNLPKLRLILLEEKTAILIEKLKDGTLDAALLALPVDEDTLETAWLFDDDFYLAVPPEHPLAAQENIAQSQLAQHKLLLLEEGHCLRDQALDVCQLHGAPQELDFTATSLETLRQMVKAGSGITFMPHIAMQPQEDAICYLPFKAPAPKRSIALVWRKTSPRKAVIAKLETLLK